MKHLDVLRGAGLVNTRSEGRRRINSLNATPLRAVIERWIGKYEAYWTNTLLRVKESAEEKVSNVKKEPHVKKKGKRA
ncbi:MAG: DNA-binding transcriptional ArsR family regulator [Pirellulaceae bacterium]|jgi:DNA-binding transcriptional ArsR family regulator